MKSRDEKLKAGEKWLQYHSKLDMLFGDTGVATLEAEYQWMKKLISALPENVELTHNPFKE